MPQGYCKECRAHVTVRAGSCLLGHSIDPSTVVAGNGRHRTPRARRLDHRQPASLRGAIGVESSLADLRPVVPSDESPSSAAHSIEPIETDAEPSPEHGPDPEPAPWRRPLLGRQRMPMLELLGFTDPDTAPIIIAAGPSTETVAELESESHQPTNHALPKPSDTKPKPGPRLADVQMGTSAENTGVLVARLWEATGDSDLPSDDWQPSETVEAPRRTFRWSFVSGAIAVTLVVALLGTAALRWPDSKAEQLRETMTADVATLDEASTNLSATIDRATDAETPTSQLADLAVPLLALSEAASQAYQTATADFTPSIPVISSEPLEALEPPRAKLQLAADKTLVIHERIGNLLDYRVLIERALVLPTSLPVEATESQISDLGVSLSDTLAQTTEVMLQLPADQILDNHRRELEAAFVQVEIDVADYLAALRSQNAFAASRTSGAMRNSAASMSDAFELTLDDFDSWLTEALQDLRAQIDLTEETLQTSGS